MMLLGDKRKIAAGIVGESPMRREEVKADFPAALGQMASEILDAVKVNDPQMLAKALSNFMQMCEKEEEYGED